MWAGDTTSVPYNWCFQKLKHWFWFCTWIKSNYMILKPFETSCCLNSFYSSVLSAMQQWLWIVLCTFRWTKSNESFEMFFTFIWGFFQTHNNSFCWCVEHVSGLFTLLVHFFLQYKYHMHDSNCYVCAFAHECSASIPYISIVCCLGFRIISTDWHKADSLDTCNQSQACNHIV